MVRNAILLKLKFKVGEKLRVKELKAFLNAVKDDEKEIFFYHDGDDPFGDGTVAIENAFEVSEDWNVTGAFKGVYLKNN